MCPATTPPGCPAKVRRGGVSFAGSLLRRIPGRRPRGVLDSGKRSGHGREVREEPCAAAGSRAEADAALGKDIRTDAECRIRRSRDRGDPSGNGRTDSGDGPDPRDLGAGIHRDSVSLAPVDTRGCRDVKGIRRRWRRRDRVYVVCRAPYRPRSASRPRAGQAPDRVGADGRLDKILAK